jgi:predicted Zn-dependent protease
MTWGVSAKRTLAAIAALCLTGSVAQAQSVLRDAETESFFRDMSAPIIAAAGMDPRNVDVVLLNDGEINAFVAGGQTVYINSGLIAEADHAEEVQGVFAHELGHIVGGHVIRDGEGAKPAMNITLLSLLLGAAAAAAGAPEAGLGIFMAGQQAAMGKYLAFSRTQEATADAASVKFLSAAGISGRGSVNFFKKLENYEYRAGFKRNEEAEFYSSHPMTADRLTTLQDSFEADPAWSRPENPDLQRRFVRIKAKLLGYLAEPQAVLNAYPEYRTDVPAHYARAYAYHKQAFMDKALSETEAILTQEPDDPYALELKGQILLESGHAAEAVAPLRRAVALTQNQPLIATTFAHALIATEDHANFAEAERVLKASVARDHDNPFAWYQLGVVYEAQGDTPRARLASAEQLQMEGHFAESLRNAQAAESTLPKGSPDWLRAQDIAMSSRAMIERTAKKK